ncbi:MAG: endonuclease, partial [Clostridiales bacterium]|nr:endonuclease [Clostridiales bacterium]
VAALILNKDTISKRPRLVKTIERVCFFLAGFTMPFTLTAAIWITPLWLLMLFTVAALLIIGGIYRGIAGETAVKAKTPYTELIACSVLFLFVFCLFSVPSFVANNGLNPKEYFAQDYYKKAVEIDGYTLYGGAGETDREHVVAQSWGVGGKNYVNDLHNVIWANKDINNKRGNKEFGEVKEHIKANEVKDSYGNVCGYIGKNSKGETVFEPLNEYKGDIARAVLYMDATYRRGDFDKSKINVALMKKWANLDKVSSKEKELNEKIKAQQGNSNKFIDTPWLVNFAV